ncbi:hypothetical protein FB451DRAFT_1380210 [Mycena latifolia]|nr:hypothetical protein FB451DRAFT_1380210 [Mycena latifolia]
MLRLSFSKQEYLKLYRGDKVIIIPYQCHKCKINESGSQKLSFCSSCKAVAYCSTKCQLEDWKGIGLQKIVGLNPHKRECPWFKRSMEQWPQPWIPNQVEILLGLAGDGAANGYWREPAFCGNSDIHDNGDSERASSRVYICHGSMLLQKELPSHIDAWTLPAMHIPLLSFDDAASKARLPALHDDRFVKDWATWYEWRKLERASPVALRMDMVLTVYHLLTKVLHVVDTSQSATTSRRRLVIHFIGAEKELNIIPLFSELALLIPKIPNTDILMSFFGPACKRLRDIAASRYRGSLATRSTVFEYAAPTVLGGSTLKVKISGEDRYAMPTDERPDALISENAGLFAYVTWQIVYSAAACNGIPWGITEYHMTEAIEYEEHMVQWRDLAILGCRMTFQTGLGCSASERDQNIACASRAQASGADVNPFMRPGLMESGAAVPRAYNGFVLRVC